MKNDLINHINTKVSAPNMEYSQLIRSGAATLDEAFRPYKNTKEMISLDSHLEGIRKNQLLAMKDLATQEQNKIAIDILNNKFEADSKALNELGANLFTYGGTKLDGTEDKYIQDLMKDFEKQTGRKDFNIDDVIRNVNDSQLALSQDLKDRINKYSEYKYNKAKLDNKILDSNDINKLGEEYYPQFGMMGQDLNSFKTLFSNNSNSFEDIAKDKAYRDAFKVMNSNRDLEMERKEELAKKVAERNQNSENEQSNNNKQVAKKSKTNQQNNNTNANNNQQNQPQQSNIKTEEQIRADDIKFQNALNNVNNGYIRADGNIQTMVNLMGTDPKKQQEVLTKVFKATGMDKLSPDKLYKPEQKLDISGNMVGLTANEINRMRSNKSSNDPTINNEFMIDLYSWAESGELLNFPLDKYEKQFTMMAPEAQEAFQVIKRMQYFNNTKYNSLFDKLDEMAKNKEFSDDKIIANNDQKLMPDHDEGRVLLERDTYLEGKIKNEQNGIFNLDNRELHNKGKDIVITANNNILKNIFGTDENIKTMIYFLATSDKVLEARFKNLNNKNFDKLVKDPEKRKEIVRKVHIALSKADDDIDSPIPISMPNNAKLAEMIVIVDAALSKNREYYTKNPAALYRLARAIYDEVNPNNIANSFNPANNDESQVNNQK